MRMQEFSSKFQLNVMFKFWFDTSSRFALIRCFVAISTYDIVKMVTNYKRAAANRGTRAVNRINTICG